MLIQKKLNYTNSNSVMNKIIRWVYQYDQSIRERRKRKTSLHCDNEQIVQLSSKINDEKCYEH